VNDHNADRAVSSDGRHARRERNRERVVDAYMELLREGVPDPSAAQLADRADVTPRTVYRYMNDDTTLKSEVGERIVAGFQFPEPAEGWNSTSLGDRIDAYLEFGLEVYDRTAPIMRVARANYATGPVVEHAVHEVRKIVREQLATLFAPELGHLDCADRQAEVMAIQVLMIFDSLEYLHAHLDRDRVHHLLRGHLRSSLSAASERAGAAPR
jgi:AcrR family transcriptional regulator